jgi:hypothetical protein
MGTKYPIASGSEIRIVLPADLEFGDIAMAELNSRTDGLADLSSAGSFKVGSRTA